MRARTYGCFLVVGLVVEVIGVELGHVTELLRLILVQLNCFLVQGMFDCVEPELIVLVERMQVLQCFCKTTQVIVNLEAPSELRQLL